jgi:class 3 adenylate cyclase
MRYVPDLLTEYSRRWQPDMDEVTIRTRLVTLFPSAAAIVNGLVMMSLFFIAGLPSIAIALLAFALVQAVTFIFGFVRPEWTSPSLIGYAIVAIGVNLYIHAESGGYTSGLWALAWVILVPLAVYLAGDRRVGTFALLLAMVAIFVASLFENRFAASPLSIPTWLIQVYNFNALSGTLLAGYIWVDFLIRELQISRRRADALLLNVLPRSTADRLKSGEATIADRYDAVTVLFADIVDFTTMSAAADPVDVVAKLNEVFSDFDDLVAKYGLEKIKTIGDAYMVAGGLPDIRPDHAEAVAAFAVDMLDAVGHHLSWSGEPIRLRVGINTGPIVAGVIGRQKFIYDVWGDAVNVASRMESNGLANQIQVTAAIREKLDGRYMFEERPPFYVKGKGMMVTYLMSPLPEPAV